MSDLSKHTQRKYFLRAVVVVIVSFLAVLALVRFIESKTELGDTVIGFGEPTLEEMQWVGDLTAQPSKKSVIYTETYIPSEVSTPKEPNPLTGPALELKQLVEAAVADKFGVLQANYCRLSSELLAGTKYLPIFGAIDTPEYREYARTMKAQIDLRKEGIYLLDVIAQGEFPNSDYPEFETVIELVCGE